MFTDLLSALKEMITSKKFIAAVAGIIVTLAAKKGLDIKPDYVNPIVGMIVAYIVGQGVADHGKAAAHISAVSEAAARGNPEAIAAVKKMSGPTKDAPGIGAAN